MELRLRVTEFEPVFEWEITRRINKMPPRGPSGLQPDFNAATPHVSMDTSSQLRGAGGLGPRKT